MVPVLHPSPQYERIVFQCLHGASYHFTHSSFERLSPARILRISPKQIIGLIYVWSRVYKEHESKELERDNIFIATKRLLLGDGHHCHPLSSLMNDSRIVFIVLW